MKNRRRPKTHPSGTPQVNCSTKWMMGSQTNSYFLILIWVTGNLIFVYESIQTVVNKFRLFVWKAGQQEKEEKQGGALKMDTFLPTIRPQEEQEGRERPSAAADTDSSTSDVFWSNRTDVWSHLWSARYTSCHLRLPVSCYFLFPVTTCSGWSKTASSCKTFA